MSEFLQEGTMQNEERSRLEERIIAFFDGSLDDEGSSSLLSEITESPEKSALFDSHAGLSRLIASARTPFEAPLEVKRQIIDRIPGMLTFLPGLLGTAETAPLLTPSTNPFIAFFTRMSLSTAISIGSAVAILTAGIFVSKDLNPSSQTNIFHNTATNSSSIVSNQEMSVAHVAFGTPSAMRSAGVAKRAETAAVETDRSPIADNHDQTVIAEKPITALVQPLPSPQPAKNIPVEQPSLISSIPMSVGEGVQVRAFVSEGMRYVPTLNVRGAQKMNSKTNETFGLEFNFGDRYSFRVQTGYSQFAQVSPALVKLFGNLKIYEASTVLQAAPWTTVGVSYTFALSPSLPLIVSVDGGAALLSQNTSLLGMMSVGTEIALFDQLSLQPTLTYDAVNTVTSLTTSQMNALPPNAIYENPTQPSMWTSSIGFQLNFVYRP